MVYLDTSVLAAYYCPEAMSAKAEKAIRRSALPAISLLVEVEFYSAVARKMREGALSEDDATRIVTRFRLGCCPTHSGRRPGQGGAPLPCSDDTFGAGEGVRRRLLAPAYCGSDHCLLMQPPPIKLTYSAGCRTIPSCIPKKNISTVLGEARG